MRSVDWPALDVNGINLSPTGYGSGLIGLPGDFTPPSRFIRALTWTQTARKTDGGEDTVLSSFGLFGMMQEDSQGPALVKKPTSFLTNCPGIRVAEIN